MKKFKFLTLSITLSFAILFSLTSCIGQTPDKTPSKTNQNNSQTQKEEQESDLLLQSFTFTVQEAPEKITELDSGNYAIKVTGAITADDIEEIRDAMLTDDKRYIALDLSETSGLTKLDEEAFCIKAKIGKTGAPLTALILPESVTEIGKNCFYGCKKMKSFTGKGVKVVNFGAFYVCSALTDIQLADEQTSIGDIAFGYCDSLTEISINAISVHEGFVSYTKKLAVVNIGPAVKNLNGLEMHENSILKTINVSPQNTNFKVIDGILYSADKSRLIRCPPALERTEIILDNTVTSIDKYAFAYCKNLKKITLTNISKLATCVFLSCPELTTVSLPIVERIDYMAFYRCEKLNSINLPDTLTYIGNDVFAYDKALSTIFIPASVTSMGETVFTNWSENQTINCEASSKPNDWDEKWNYYSYSSPAKATINWGVRR